MTNLSKATAAPINYTLANGKTITLHPLTLEDVGEFEQWIRGELFKVSHAQLVGESFPKNERDSLMQNVFLACAQISMFSGNAQGLIGSLGGIARLVSLSMRHSDATATPDSVYDMLRGLTGLAKVSEKVIDLSGFGDEPESKDGTPKKVVTGTSQG